MGTLAVFAPFGTYQVHHQLDQVLATYLRVRGFQAFAIRCDGLYPACDVLAWSGANAINDCRSCVAQGEEAFALFNIPVLQMRSFLNQGDFREVEAWVDTLDPEQYKVATFLGKPLGQWVSSSVCSFFRITERDFHQPRVRKAHRQFLINGLLTYRAVQRIFDQQKPTHCSIFNGRMAPYRVALEVARERKLPAMVHERGWADNTFVTFDNRIAIETTPIYECARNWADVPLTIEQSERVRSYFANREQGKDINLLPFVTYATDYAKVRTSLRIPADARFFLVCTTSEYELGFCDDFQTSIGQLDFIRELIEIFRDRPEYLVIRHHPSIGGEVVGPPDFNYLTRCLKLSESLPENVRVINSTEQLSSYALFWHAQASFAPFSMTGVEAIARGVPAAGFKQSPFREGLCAWIDRCSRDEIRSLVDALMDPECQVTVDDLRKLYRSQYAFISRLCVQFKLFGIANNYNPDIRINSAEDFQTGHDPELDRVARFFTEGESLHKLPADSDRMIAAQPESDFLAEEYRAIREKRALVKSQSDAYVAGYKEQGVAVIKWGSNVGESRWRSSITAGRHRNIQIAELDSFTFESLIAALDSTQMPFCTFCTPQIFSYDEAFFARGSDLLTESNPSEVEAVFFAAQLLDKNRAVTRVYFGQHKPIHSEQELFDAYGDRSCWQVLLASMVFRTPFARVVLSHLQSLQTDQERYLVMSTLILQGKIKRAKDALVSVQTEI